MYRGLHSASCFAEAVCIEFRGPQLGVRSQSKSGRHGFSLRGSPVSRRILDELRSLENLAEATPAAGSCDHDLRVGRGSKGLGHGILS